MPGVAGRRVRVPGHGVAVAGRRVPAGRERDQRVREVAVGLVELAGVAARRRNRTAGNPAERPGPREDRGRAVARDARGQPPRPARTRPPTAGGRSVRRRGAGTVGTAARGVGGRRTIACRRRGPGRLRRGRRRRGRRRSRPRGRGTRPAGRTARRRSGPDRRNARRGGTASGRPIVGNRSRRRTAGGRRISGTRRAARRRTGRFRRNRADRGGRRPAGRRRRLAVGRRRLRPDGGHRALEELADDRGLRNAAARRLRIDPPADLGRKRHRQARHLGGAALRRPRRRGRGGTAGGRRR